MDIILRQVRIIFDQILLNDFPNISTIEAEEKFENLHKTLFGSLKKLNPYLFSASIDSDNDGFLTMWRDYGDKSESVGLVFDVDICDTYLAFCLKYSVILNDVDSDALHTKKFYNYIAMLNSGINPNSEFLKKLLQIVMSYKHPGFIDEREVKYLLKQLPRSEIKRIIVGPSTVKEQDKVFTELNLIVQKYPEPIEIVRSSIPFLWD